MSLSYHNLSDFELTSMIRQDDHLAYRELYYRYTEVLYSHAYTRLQDREEARDVVQEVFSKLWIKRSSISFEVNIAGYLYTAVRNRILNLYAQEKRRSQLLDSFCRFTEQMPVEPDASIRISQLQKIVEQEIEKMPPKMRAVFELSRKQQLSHKEIARHLGISVKTVKNQVNGALKILRSRLGTINYVLFIFF